ncbi:MAG: hypothetical protein R3B96_08090 [Pirellulaceae bacterium]
MILTTHPRLKPIRDKVEAGERLNFDDGMLLYDESIPLNDVGQLANLVRERVNGNRTYYNINTHLNPTNVCVYRCNFCAFRSDLRGEKSYAMNDEQILQRGQEAVDNGCTEMHIVGGLHHQKSSTGTSTSFASCTTPTHKFTSRHGRGRAELVRVHGEAIDRRHSARSA